MAQLDSLPRVSQTEIRVSAGLHFNLESQLGKDLLQNSLRLLAESISLWLQIYSSQLLQVGNREGVCFFESLLSREGLGPLLKGSSDQFRPTQDNLPLVNSKSTDYGCNDIFKVLLSLPILLVRSKLQVLSTLKRRDYTWSDSLGITQGMFTIDKQLGTFATHLHMIVLFFAIIFH